ncbi:MAG: NPCBM/NEW2 domain-containing protein [Bacteroidales bacterium]|nr:NPCBM/NEW2 domain-containing protein [Bacteroidales bacterium]
MKTSVAILVFLSFCACASRQDFQEKQQLGYIRSGETWLDTDEAPIESHAGGFLYRDGIYYWYGENHAKGFYNKTGISCYSSTDLINWKNEGIVMPRDSFPLLYRSYTNDEVIPEGCSNNGVAERPKVIYNEKTKKYVMWVHLDADGYVFSTAGVAVSDSPVGPFTFLKEFRPVKYRYSGIDDENGDKERTLLIDEKGKGNTYRDMNLFVDDDGKAYVFYASENNATLYIVRLNDQYTDIERPLKENENWARALPFGYREAPAPFKHKGKYYMITSGLTGWTPNPAQYHVADHILGPWKTVGDPCIGPESESTFHSQSTFVLPVEGKPEGSFIFMADRWNGHKLENSRFVWLPFIIGDDSEIRLEYFTEWNWDVFDQVADMPSPPHVKLNLDKVLTWQSVKGANAYRIYKNGEYVAVTSNTQYVLPEELAGKAYNFTVMAMKLNGQSSLPSKPVTVSWEEVGDVFLSDVKPDRWAQHWGFLRYDRALENGPLNVAGQVFEKGFGTHAPGEIVYRTCGKYSRLKGYCGVDNYASFDDVSSIGFKIIGDGKILFETDVMRVNTPAAAFDVDVAGISELKLITTDGGDGTHLDHADWCDVYLVK